MAAAFGGRSGGYPLPDCTAVGSLVSAGGSRERPLAQDGRQGARAVSNRRSPRAGRKRGQHRTVSELMVETRDLDENMLLDIDGEDNVCGITIEHASERAGIPGFSYEQIPD